LSGPASAAFTHLHVASSYSLRYGTATPAALAVRAAELGMPSLALTDRDGLHGAFKHARECRDAGIKPLLGADLALSGSARVTLLATGRQGWASLCRLVSAAHAAGGHAAGGHGAGGHGAGGAPAVTPEMIAGHQDGLVLLLGPDSDVGQAIAARRPDIARNLLRRWHSRCESVIEIVDHLGKGDTFAAARMAALARDEHVPAVLTNAVRYAEPADSMAAQILDAARNLVPLGSPKLAPQGGRAYLASSAEMAGIARRIAGAAGSPDMAAEVLRDTAELASRCELDPAKDLGMDSHHLPETSGEPFAALRARCERAIINGRYRSAGSRPGGTSRMRAAKTARERLEHELDIIAQTRMASYFLTVADIAARIRARGIRCAIRGSGAGSFVNHLLGISAVDPIEHDLLMERFLSPIRGTLPDIDLDVESARRLEAYQVIFDAYGPERTVCVAMMETYRARSAIRDVAAAMSLPPDETGRIAKAFPHIRARHITAALTELPELRDSRLAGSRLATVFRLAEQLDGLPRHVAMHPCGILLSDATLKDRTATQRSGEGFPLSHLDKDDAEIAGVIKLDVLGVRMQSAMAHALSEIKRVTGEDVDIDAVRRDDQDTYEMIRSARTIGCFQIESPGQRELVKKLAPRDVGDLITDISLFRPGPVSSDMITPFLRARHGQCEPRFPHESLRAALAETGGVVVFHEQVLRILDAMTGCGLPEADLVRRALSAPGGPERTGVWFRARAAGRGYDPVTVERVWEVVAAFGGFGFCKAHAAAFAVPVYQSAWLKRHYPAEFYAGVLTHDPGMYPKRVIIQDARLAGVEVLPLDVNASRGEWKSFSRTDRGARGPGRFRKAVPPGQRGPRGAIRVSLREVKGISDAEVDAVVTGQPYTSLRDFTERARVSRPVTERLVLAGAFDSLYATPAPAPTRRDLLARVGVLDRSAARGAAPALNLPGLGDGLEDLVPAGQLRELDHAERVEAELEILGFDVSGHVLGFYVALLDGLGTVRSADLDDCRPGEEILVAGVKVATQTPAVRSGQRVIFATLDDAAGLVDLTFFESVQDRCASRLFGSWLLLVRGRVRRSGAGPTAVSMNARECWDIPALEEIRLAEGMDAVRSAMAAGDVGPGARRISPSPDEESAHTRPFTFPNGFAISPYAETGGPGGSLKAAPRTLWHASPGSAGGGFPADLQPSCAAAGFRRGNVGWQQLFYVGERLQSEELYDDRAEPALDGRAELAPQQCRYAFHAVCRRSSRGAGDQRDPAGGVRRGIPPDGGARGPDQHALRRCRQLRAEQVGVGTQGQAGCAAGDPAVLDHLRPGVDRPDDRHEAGLHPRVVDAPARFQARGAGRLHLLRGQLRHVPGAVRDLPLRAVHRPDRGSRRRRPGRRRPGHRGRPGRRRPGHRCRPGRGRWPGRRHGIREGTRGVTRVVPLRVSRTRGPRRATTCLWIRVNQIDVSFATGRDASGRLLHAHRKQKPPITKKPSRLPTASTNGRPGGWPLSSGGGEPVRNGGAHATMCRGPRA
jgi:error-prone DNA polymerase